MCIAEASKTNCRECVCSDVWKLAKPNHYYSTCSFRARMIMQNPRGFCYYTYDKSKKATEESLDFCQYYKPKSTNE